MQPIAEVLAPDSPHQPWWGSHHFDIQQSRAWQLGGLLLRITRSEQEWRVEYHRSSIEAEADLDWQDLADVHFAMPHPCYVERYMFAQTQTELVLMPRLADRSVVIKPIDPIYIPAGQKGTLYISTPLWIAAYVPQQKQALFELPVAQPKDTWFGPNARVGEMCYATQVDGRTDLSLLQPRPFRAVTPIEVSNHSDQQLRFERMNIPVPALPLFYSASTGRLWTSQIRVSYDNADRVPRVRIESRTSSLAGDVHDLHAPRVSSGVLVNMFDAIF